MLGLRRDRGTRQKRREEYSRRSRRDSRKSDRVREKKVIRQEETRETHRKTQKGRNKVEIG